MTAKKRTDEKESVVESEAVTEASTSNAGDQLVDEAQLDSQASEEETDTTQVTPAELAAIHTDTITAKEASEGKAPKKIKTSVTPAKERVRSARYLKAFGSVDTDKTYNLKQALELAQQTSYSTFPGSVELHARLMAKKGKGIEAVRGLLQLPHGTGKTVNAVILTEEIIAQIATAKSTTYDVLIAPKALMPKVATIAKILGPLGKMPSPKAGTVADKPEETLVAIQSGRTEYRSDNSGNIHLTIGKANWEVEKLLENADVAAHALPRNQLQSLTISTTMGPGIRVDMSSL